MIEDLFHLPLVMLTPVANLELRISPRIFEKIRNDPNGIIRGWGKLIHEKNQKQKSRDTVLLSLVSQGGEQAWLDAGVPRPGLCHCLQEWHIGAGD
jgi:hypothetical protein